MPSQKLVFVKWDYWTCLQNSLWASFLENPLWSQNLRARKKILTLFHTQHTAFHWLHFIPSHVWNTLKGGKACMLRGTSCSLKEWQTKGHVPKLALEHFKHLNSIYVTGTLCHLIWMPPATYFCLKAFIHPPLSPAFISGSKTQGQVLTTPVTWGPCAGVGEAW